MAPRSQYFRKIDVDVQLFGGGPKSFLILNDSENQKFSKFSNEIKIKVSLFTLPGLTVLLGLV